MFLVGVMTRQRWLALLACCFLWACSGEEGPHILYEQDVQSLDNPFPDMRLVQDGRLLFRPQWYRPCMMDKALNGGMVRLLDGLADEARTLAGFGNMTPMLLLSSEPLDAASFDTFVARLQKTDSG